MRAELAGVGAGFYSVPPRPRASMPSAPRSNRSAGAERNLGQLTAAAAARIASMVTCGCDTIETCEPATSVIVAPARSAMLRCVAGGMTRSSVPTTAQLGSVFQAAAPEGVVLALSVIGRWLGDDQPGGPPPAGPGRTNCAPCRA